VTWKGALLYCIVSYYFLYPTQVYATDRQIPESGTTGSAIQTGVKTRYNVIGYDDSVEWQNCSTEKPEALVPSLRDMAEEAGTTTAHAHIQNDRADSWQRGCLQSTRMPCRAILVTSCCPGNYFVYFEIEIIGQDKPKWTLVASQAMLFNSINLSYRQN
jgi:hypothetical protein